MSSKYSFHLKRIFREARVEFFRKPLSFFLSLMLIIFLLWLTNAIWMAAIFKTAEEAGPAGDLFGAINSLFTGLAFAGLIGTMIFQQRELKLQRKELRLQREEVAHTRIEIAGQREQMELQNKQMQKQKQMFEQTFFQMLRVFNEYIQDINGPPRNGADPRKGREQIGYMVSTIHLYSHSTEEVAVTYLKGNYPAWVSA